VILFGVQMPPPDQIQGSCTSGETAFTDRTSSGSRITELARVAATAMSALMICTPLLFAARPKTPLRVFCIAAFEFLARLGGDTLGKQRRIAIAHACDFGSLRDDYYDRRVVDATKYRSLRSKLRSIAPEKGTSRYIRQLRQAERCRPILTPGNPGTANSVIAYRTSVLDLSLRWMQELSGLHIDSMRFHVLLNLVGLMQLADDVLDWKEDQAVACPSYVTAFLMDLPCNAVVLPLREQADTLLQRLIAAARRDTGAVPLAIAGVLTWTCVVALLRLRFPQ